MTVVRVLPFQQSENWTNARIASFKKQIEGYNAQIARAEAKIRFYSARPNAIDPTRMNPANTEKMEKYQAIVDDYRAKIIQKQVEISKLESRTTYLLTPQEQLAKDNADTIAFNQQQNIEQGYNIAKQLIENIGNTNFTLPYFMEQVAKLNSPTWTTEGDTATTGSIMPLLLIAGVALLVFK